MFLILLLLAAAGLAQAEAELFGLISDTAGLPASGAELRLRNGGTQAEWGFRTGPDGTYHFSALPSGAYRLTVSKAGFAQLVRNGVVLRVGDRTALDVALQVGEVSQTVEVSGQAPLLQAARGTAGYIVDQKKMVNLPLDGRNFVPLLALSPGVSLPPGSTLPRINGSRPRTSEYIYDGISVLQPEPGQVAYFPIVDAIEEFRVETNSYSAEYGRANGGIILVNQKAGRNALHGTLFEFFRNEALNARNLFAPAGERPRFRRNQYGFVLGGPVRKNRLFFFVDWQGTRLQTGTVRTSTVPTSAQRRGIFATTLYDPATTRLTESGYVRDPLPGNTIPAARLDPAALPAFDRYPAPNVFDTAGAEAVANNYRRVGNERLAQDQADARLDQYAGVRHRLMGRYTSLRDFARPVTPLPDGSGSITSGVSGNTLTRAGSVAAEHSWTLAADRVNQLRFGFTRRGFDRTALRGGQAASPGAFSDTSPSFQLVGYQLLGPPANANAQFTTSVTQFIDQFTWVRGQSSWKLGADVRRQTLDVLQPASPGGLFQFTHLFTAGLSAAGAPVAGTGSSVASFLLGQVQEFQIDVQRETLQPRATVAEFYAQNDLRVNRRLSVNLGARYTLNLPSTEAHDRGAVFDLDRQKLDYLGKDGFPRSARNLEWGNLGPRAGLAWRMGDSLALRAGYGLTWIEQAGITTPFTTPLFPFVRTLQQFSRDNIHPAFVLASAPRIEVEQPNADSGVGQGVFGVQRDQKSGYAQQWNLSLQKTLGEDWSVEAGYLGSKLTNLGVPDVNLNQLRVEQLGQTPLPPRPYPQFTTVALYRNNVGHSTYHSLQARVEKRFARGLTFSAAYTYSRLIDDAGAVFDAALLTGPAASFQAADSYNRQLEKDFSTGDIPHIFSGGFVYEWGGGWRIAGLVRAQAGSPVAVSQQPNLNAFAGFGMQRPNRLRDPALPAAERRTARWFDTGSFSAAPPFTLGNSSRNPVRGPGYRTVDLMAGRTFRLAERWMAEVRAEGFNITNTPALGNPNGAFGTAGFGTITTALDPRVFELVLKVRF